MAYKIILLIFIFLIKSNGVESSKIINQKIADTIQSKLNDVFELIKLGGIDIGNGTSFTFNDANAVGNLNISDITLLTLGVSNETSTDATDKVDAIVDCSLNIADLKLEIDYSADVALLDKVPIFGSGKVTIQLSEVQLKLYLAVNTESILSIYFENSTALTASFRHFPNGVKITGFWNNDEASELLSNILSVGEHFLAMWWTYNNKDIDCLLSQLLQNIRPSSSPLNCNSPEDIHQHQLLWDKIIEGIVAPLISENQWHTLTAAVKNIDVLQAINYLLGDVADNFYNSLNESIV